MTSPALAAQDVCKRFRSPTGPVQALDHVSMRVEGGSLTALVGPDGAGKTTLLRMAAGLLKSDSGELAVLGLDVSRHAAEIQARISYMPQRFGLYEDLSVQENLDLYADLHNVPSSQRTERYARLMAMTDLGRFTRRPAGKLSGGMKQKLGLACTLVRAPELLLLDEPTVGVDPLSRQELWEILTQLVRDEALPVVVSTAYMDEAARCDQVVVLHEGRVLAQGTPDTLRRDAEGLCYTVRPREGQPARILQAQLLDDESIVDAVPRGGLVRFIHRAESGSAPGPALQALLDSGQSKKVEPELEDSFMLRLHDRRRPDPSPPVPTNALATSAPGPVPASTDKPVIEVRDLVRRFGDFVAVDHASFAVRQGEIFGLLGPNGAGKTTTFRMLCGLLPATSGFIQVAGNNLRTAGAQARRGIGYVAQKFALYGNLTVDENLAFFGKAYGLYGKALSSRMAETRQQFGLQDLGKAPAGQLPGGYKQRLAMATGLLHRPDILFLDEPTSGADPLARREFWRRITALSASGITVIVTTHFMEEAEYCDRVVIQDAGRILAMGTPWDIRRQAGGTADMESAFIAIVRQGRQAQSADGGVGA